MSDSPDNGGQFDTLHVERDARSMQITLNRAGARNAMSLQMCRDLIAAFAGIRFDQDLRVVLIRGADPVFCAGIDLKEMKDKPVPWVLERRNLGLDAFQAIENCPIPVVAAVQGTVVGAGCEIMAACDFALATEDTTFRWPEVIWGAVGATQRLPRLVGMSAAKDLLFTGRTITAREAKDLGLVSRVIRTGEFAASVGEVVDQLRDGFPLAARLVKKSMMLGRDVPIHVGIDIERQLIERSLADPEWSKGNDLFAETMRKKAG